MNEKKVEIKIGTSADLRAMREVEAGLRQQIVAAQAAGKDYSDLQKQLDRVSDSMRQMGVGGRMKAEMADLVQGLPVVGNFARALNGAGGVITLGVGALASLTKGLSDSVREFALAEVSVAKLDAALGNSGLLDGTYRSELQKLAGEMQGRTAISDESWLDVFSTLTKFGADPTNIREYSKAVENLAGMLGGDVTQAAFLFGKAMQGQTEMLGRYGIVVDKSKSSVEQLRDIMRQLDQRGGGQLEAMANTLEGRVRKIGLAWGDVQEGIGQATIKLIDFFAQMAGQKDTATYLENFSKGLSIIAGISGDKENRSGAKNRGTFIADNPEDQALADDLAARRQTLLQFKAEQEELRAKFFNRSLHAPPKMRGVEEQSLALAEQNIDSANAALRNLETEMARIKGSTVSPMESGKLATARAEEDRLKVLRGAFEIELAIGEAVATGNEEQAKRLTWLQAYQKALIDTEGSEELARRTANLAVTKPQDSKESEKAARREELALELQIAEAKAAGNEAETRRLELQREYNRLLKDALAAGVPEDQAHTLAWRGAEAKAAAEASGSQLSAVPVGDLAARGGGMAVSMAAASAMMENKAARDALQVAREHFAESQKHTRSLAELERRSQEPVEVVLKYQ